MWSLTGTIEWPLRALSSREESNTAFDVEEEMQIESESFVDTREFLPRDGPITYNRHGSLVALVAEDESMPETQENVVEADERVKTEVVRERLTFWLVCCITHFYFSYVYQNKISSLSAVLLV